MGKIINLILQLFRPEQRKSEPKGVGDIANPNLSRQSPDLISRTAIPEVKPFIFVHDRTRPNGRAPEAQIAPRFPVLQDKERTDARKTREDDEDDYAAFVERMWMLAQIRVGAIALTCDGNPCTIVSVTSDNHPYPYVNMWLDGERVTYAGDGRHEWVRDGMIIDASAFLAVLTGVPPEKALQFDPYPESIEAALVKDRVNTTERRFVIRYCNNSGFHSWRVISRIWRGHDHMTARCHFRWGQRRTFTYAHLEEIIDIETGEIIPLMEFATGAALPPRRTPKGR